VLSIIFQNVAHNSTIATIEVLYIRWYHWPLLIVLTWLTPLIAVIAVTLDTRCVDYLHLTTYRRLGSLWINADPVLSVPMRGMMRRWRILKATWWHMPSMWNLSFSIT